VESQLGGAKQGGAHARQHGVGTRLLPQGVVGCCLGALPSGSLPSPAVSELADAARRWRDAGVLSGRVCHGLYAGKLLLERRLSLHLHCRDML